MKSEQFNDWYEAFDCCRERNKPVIATVDDGNKIETCKVYPSGTCKLISKRPIETITLMSGQVIRCEDIDDDVAISL